MTDPARLVLMTPPAGQDPALPEKLADALAEEAVAAVILRLPPLDERGLVKLAKPFAAVVQERGAALLLADRPQSVARSGADGAHIGDPGALPAALQALHPGGRIVGAGGLRTRHDAMEAAETGCDYVMIGEPDAQGFSPPFPAVLERARWWSELFRTPCVAFCPELGAIGALAATGCEFIALGEAVFSHAQGPRRAVELALAATAAAGSADR